MKKLWTRFNIWMHSIWVMMFIATTSIILFGMDGNWFAAGWALVSLLWMISYRKLRLDKEHIEMQFREFIKGKGAS